MFDLVRNNKRVVQLFLAVITLPFAFWGVESYVQNAGAGSDIAVVGSSKITPQQFQQAWREHLDELRARMGAEFNAARVDTPDTRMALLDQMINQRVLLEEARRQHLHTSDEQLRLTIAAVPQLQEGGKFSNEKYEALVRSRGLTQAGFEAQLRQDLTLQQIAGAVGESAVSSQSAASAFIAALAEQRQVAEVRFAPEAYVGQVKVGEDDLRKHYDATAKDYQLPEQARLAFVVLSGEALKAQVKVSADEVKAWYDGHVERYQSPEERRASHILILAEAGAAAEVKDKAKARAEELLKQISASPASFDALAKQHSEDPGSKEKGGDLGFFARGAMVKPFEDAAFALKEGQVSGIVTSDFGFHIIKLTGIKPGKQRALDEVRGEIESELKQQQAQRRYAEAAEAFANMAYEQSDSVQPIAEKFGLPVQETAWVVKGRPVTQPGSPFAHPKLIASVFSDDVVKNKRNTEAVEIAPSTLVAARIIEHKPAAQQPFEAVKVELLARLQRKEAAVLTVKAGEAKLAEYQAGKDGGLNFAPPKTVSRLTVGGSLPPAAAQAVFKLDGSKLPAYTGLTDVAGAYVLYRVSAAEAPLKLDPRQDAALRGEFAKLVAQEEFDAYLASLRKRYSVEINRAALEGK